MTNPSDRPTGFPLPPGAELLLRRLAPRDDMPWLCVMSVLSQKWQALSTDFFPDEGWRVHDAGDGAIALESLNLPPSYPPRWLYAGNAAGTAELAARDAADADGLRWRVHPTAHGTFYLECLGARPGGRLLSVDTDSGRGYELTGRPEGRSKGHEFVALPRADGPAIRAAEDAGDFSHMVPFGMRPDGEIPAMPVPPKPKPPLTSADPVVRSAGDPVREELIAALLPSFEDGDLGAECSSYEHDDPRQVGWPHNVVSLDTVVLSSGTVCLHREPVEHASDPQELELCRKLAAEVVAALGDRDPGGGDSAGPSRPFYLVIGRDEQAPESLTAEAVRAAFHGTLFEGVPIEVRPFLRQPAAGRQRPRRNPPPDPWQGFREWAAAHPTLRAMAEVDIGCEGNVYPSLAASYPRLVLGLTPAGSLVGACGFVVQA